MQAPFCTSSHPEKRKAATLCLGDPPGDLQAQIQHLRFNALRPGNPAEEAEKIDALLKEFKLKAPPAPME